MSTIHEQITEAKRELGLRKWTYPKRVQAKFMTQQEADHYLSLQRDIIATLASVAMAEQPLLFPEESASQRVIRDARTGVDDGPPNSIIREKRA